METCRLFGWPYHHQSPESAYNLKLTDVAFPSAFPAALVGAPKRLELHGDIQWVPGCWLLAALLLCYPGTSYLLQSSYIAHELSRI
jgi:hypothetical protein